MRHYPVVIVGGGVTGIGVLRDLSMRGIKALLVEQRDLCQGTSSRFHGLLHSGGRYAVNDPVAAEECITENMILKKIAPYSIELTEGLFVRTAEDDEGYEEKWVAACEKAGIPAKPLSVKKALELEPNLSPDIRAVYRVPDSAVDSFRMVWQNAKSAADYGGEFRTYSELIDVIVRNGAVTGVVIRNTLSGITEEIGCDFLVSAAGSWVGQVARMADVDVNVMPDRGLLLAFNHRFAGRIVNRLRKSGDADIFVPHGSITILGTTSIRVDDPADILVTSKEALYMLNMGEKLFPDIYKYRLLRGFAGTRPLYTSKAGPAGRSATRNFVVLDHEDDGVKGFATIVGGKFTTFRLMAERMGDLVAAKLGNTEPCRTHLEPLVRRVGGDVIKRAGKYFPSMGVTFSVNRQGDDFVDIVERVEKDPGKSALLCECELVTRAEFEQVASESTSHSLSDVRRRTRMGMGTCQGNFCGFRGVGAVVESGLMEDVPAKDLLMRFIEERWGGIRAILWGTQMKEVELSRGIYSVLFNVDGVGYEE